MKKLTIEKEEGVAEVVDRVLAEQDDEITLVIPNASALGRSVRNFHLLKREVEAGGKSIVIESVDETILAFAKESDIEASHPLWRGVHGAGGISDIIPAEEATERPQPKRRAGAKKKAEHPVKLVVPDEDEESSGEEGQEEEAKEEEETFEKEGSSFFGRRSASKADEGDDYDNEEASGGRRGSRKIIVWGVVILVVLIAVLGLLTWSFGRVMIAINFQKTPWTYSGTVVADKSVATISATATTLTIPAQVFTAPKNMTQSFPATGNANVSIKAQGTITIVNAYSSAPQDLVATTRFVTPDGHLFRLVNSVTVPGAQVTNGQIVPSSIDAPVAADQPGPDYNVGPVTKLTIPGFQGSPKYDAFYGELKTGTSGGFVGNKAVPTAADITSAKAKITAALTTSLTSALTTSYPNNFKILDGATNVAVTKLTVSTTTDANGNFSIFGEATLSAIGFDESALEAYLLSVAQVPGAATSTFTAFSPSYSAIQANFTKGTVTFTLTGTGTLEPAFDPNAFKASIAGESINAARSAIAAIPGLSDGKISAWPMWLWSIPGNASKINVTAN